MRAMPREVNEAFIKDADDAYALGLWCADSYWWSSSIGISNVEPELVVRFSSYLGRWLPRERLRVRVYLIPGEEPDERVLDLTDRVPIRPAVKMRRTASHAYVNSRVLVRSFISVRARVSELPSPLIGPCIAGRFDGDGCLGSRVRIAYTTEEEARVDQALLGRAGILATSVLPYASASEWCVYIHKKDVEKFRKLIEPASWKLMNAVHPVETAMASVPGKLPNL